MRKLVVAGAALLGYHVLVLDQRIKRDAKTLRMHQRQMELLQAVYVHHRHIRSGKGDYLEFVGGTVYPATTLEDLRA